MSYLLADSNGSLGDFTNIGGLSDFHAWARAVGGPVGEFARDGYTEDLDTLQNALESLTAEGRVEEQRNLLLDALRKAQGILIVSDGLSRNDFRSASSPRRNVLHDVAEAFAPKFATAAKYVFAQGRAAADQRALKVATTAHEADAAMSAVPSAVRKAVGEVFPEVVLACFNAGGKAGWNRLRAKGLLRTAAAAPLEMQTSFKELDPAAAEWAREHVAQLMTDLSATTQQDIAEAIASGFEGKEPGDVFEDILDAVGDADRAELISQNESMTAVNKGQRESWSQAQDAGLLPSDAEREWIASDLACDDCLDLDGETAPLGEDYDGDGGDGPPLHVRCECTEGISSGSSDV